MENQRSGLTKKGRKKMDAKKISDEERCSHKDAFIDEFIDAKPIKVILYSLSDPKSLLTQWESDEFKCGKAARLSGLSGLDDLSCTWAKVVLDISISYANIQRLVLGAAVYYI
ncbi:hypothetical protein Tco_1270202 [Tanacetum coccineum]